MKSEKGCIGGAAALLGIVPISVGLGLVAALRRAGTSFGGKLMTAGGLLPSGNREVEHVIRLVKQKAAISKRVLFLDQAQRVFHLWHVIHRPFSYAFAVLALFHIAVVLGMGFGTMGFR